MQRMKYRGGRGYFTRVAGGAATLILLIAAPSCLAVTIRDDAANNTAYVNLSAEAQYAASGYVTVADTDTTFILGSGTLISPSWVLTAAHIVTDVDADGVPAYAAAKITFGQGASRPGGFVGTNTISQVVVMTGWAGNPNNGTDLALIKLTNPITTVTPAKLYDAALGTEKSQTATFVGYGYSGTGLTGESPNNTRLAFRNVVDAFGGEKTSGPNPDGPGNFEYDYTDKSSKLMLTDFDRPNNTKFSLMGDTAPLTLEGSAAEGDSGGGLFLTVDGKTYLAGVANFIGAFSNNALSAKGDGHYGDDNGFLRVSDADVAKFIYATIPEPSSMTLAAIDLIGLLVIKLQRRMR